MFCLLALHKKTKPLLIAFTASLSSIAVHFLTNMHILTKS